MNKRLAITSFCASLLLSVSAHANQKENTCDSVSSRMAFLDKNASFTVNVFPQNKFSLGSGIVFKDKEGWGIITNNHVVGDSPFAAYVVFLGEDKITKVTIVGRDPALDIALLSVPDRVPPSVTPIDLSKHLRGAEVGDEVYAVGYARGAWMPTVGWVNSKTSPISPIFFTHQTPLQPGNSGGPLVYFKEKCDIEVVGVNTGGIPGGVNLVAVSLKHVKKMLPRLRSEKVVEHAYTGLHMFDVQKLPPPVFEKITRRQYQGESGVFVVATDLGSPAEKAGMQAGDIITELKYTGQSVSFKNAEDLFMRIFFDFKPKDEIEFVTKRGTQSFIRKIVLGGTKEPPIQGDQ